MCACGYRCPRGTKEDVGSFGNGAIGSCELPDGCVYWELKSGSLQKQQVPLDAEPSLQPYCIYISFMVKILE